MPIIHVCEVDGVIGESTFRFGAVVWAFMELPFSMTVTCPRCGKLFAVRHVPSADDMKAAAESDWIAMEETSFAAREAALAQGSVPPSMEEE